MRYLSGAGHAPRLTWEQHFTQANLAHDGHLTLPEAKGGYPLVAKHFDDIDTDHKGYVTENDIRAWQTMRQAVRYLMQPLPPKAAAQPVRWDHPVDTRGPVPASVPAGPVSGQ
jgi:hypothetical protein